MYVSIFKVFILRIIFCIFLSIFCSLTVYSFGGKPVAVENVELYYTAPSTVVVDVYLFTNNSGDKNYDYLSYTIADLIASQIKYNKTLLVDEKKVEFQPANLERIYDFKAFQLSNTVYTAKISDTNISNASSATVTIASNVEYSWYTNWGSKRSNVNIISPQTTNIKLAKSNEMFYNYKGTNILVRGFTNFNLPVSVSENYLYYEGKDIEQYVFKRPSDYAVYGTITKTRRTVIVEAFIAEIKSKKLTSYKVEVANEDVDEGLNRYAFEIANRINSMPKTGIVAVKTEPKSSLVYIDDVYIGKSDDLLYITALTTNSHKFSIRNDFYYPIDTMLSFSESENKNVFLDFSLEKITNIGSVAITLPDKTNSQVIINGVKEIATNYIEKELVYGTHSLKIVNESYKDYYAMFTLSSTNTLNIIPNMILKREPTLAERIFKNYERNTKIMLGLTIATVVFSMGSYIYANEVFDATLSRYDALYRNDANRPPIDLTEYNKAMNVYWVGLGVSAVFALASGVYYMLWVGEDDFKVEELSFKNTGNGFDIRYTMRF